MELYEYTVHELVEKLEKGEVTSEEITRSYFDRIKEIDPKVKAYVSTLEDEAIAKAKKVDEDRKAGKTVSKQKLPLICSMSNTNVNWRPKLGAYISLRGVQRSLRSKMAFLTF